MRKSPRIVFCLASFIAVLIGQMTALGATTNAVYDVTSISMFKVGKLHVTVTNAATSAFLSDGTCDLDLGSYHFTGDYAVTPNGKQVALTLDTDGKAALESNVVDLIESYASGATVSVTGARVSKISIKSGAPFKATDTVRGKLSETVGGRLRKRGFSLKTLWTDWELVSGTNL